jgi:hypothetical protein
MFALALYLVALASPSPASRCEELGPRLDGTYVTVCDGSVVRIRDDQGNSREYRPRFVVARSRGAAPLVLGTDGR